VGQIVTLLNSKDDGTVISSFDYGYDPVGNRLNVAEVDGTRVTWQAVEISNGLRESPKD
jgi:hypothetical protein